MKLGYKIEKAIKNDKVLSQLQKMKKSMKEFKNKGFKIGK